MKQLTITEWFARAVAAGLMPDWENIIYRNGYITNTMDSIKIPFDKPDRIILRSNGKDLYSLEWRKPTEKDVGKMCWFYGGMETVYAELHEISMLHGMVYDYCAVMDLDTPQYDYCLLADHPFPPKEQDFKRIYGE